MAQKKRKWLIVLFIVLGIFFFMIFLGIVSLFFGVDSTKLPGNVALIEIKGVIVGDRQRGDFFGTSTSSEDVVELIEKAKKNPAIKAVVFEINSPGGSAVASDEIGQAIKDLDKISVAWIREVGASGGYWVASATDHIIANRMSITGSIGVIASYLEFSGLMKDYNVTYQRMVAGKYKDIGSPFKPLSDEERDLFQERLDVMRDYFIDEVASNRNLPRESVDEIATGLFYLGTEAKELGLVDQLGSKKEVIEYLKEKIGEVPEIVEYKKSTSLFDILGEVMSRNSFFVGRGIGSMIFDRNSFEINT